MKIKYGFKKIYSNADKITVQAYGRDFMTFNKEDFGNDWQNLIDKGEIFDIEPTDVADLDKVTCTGTEIKKPEYDTETRNKWFDYAQQFLDISDLGNEEKLSEIDFDKPITLCNKDVLNNGSLFIKFKSYYMDGNDEVKKEKYNKMLIDLSNFKFPSSFIYSYNINGRTYSNYYYPRLGDTSDSFGLLVAPEKIVKIPSNYATYVNNALNGSLAGAFKNCANLEIDCDLLSNIIPSSLYNTFYNCKSVKNIDKLNLSLISDYNALTPVFYKAKLDEIPKNFLDKMNSLTQAKPFSNCEIGYIDELKTSTSIANTNNTIKLINKLYISYDFTYCGNIDSINYIEISDTRSYISAHHTTINKIGIINSINYCGLAVDSSNFPKSIDAFHYYGKTSTFSVPKSTGYEYWADYIEVDTDACKNITERSLALSDHITTLDNKLSDFEIKIPYNKLLRAVTNYNHTFEVESIKTAATNSGSVINVENAKYKSISRDTENKNVIITVDFTDIKDDSISTISISKLYLEYTAKIDGYQFTGKTLINVDIKYDFTLDEDIDMPITIIEDEQ